LKAKMLPSRSSNSMSEFILLGGCWLGEFTCWHPFEKNESQTGVKTDMRILALHHVIFVTN
jgi:hypothetical protein